MTKDSRDDALVSAGQGPVGMIVDALTLKAATGVIASEIC